MQGEASPGIPLHRPAWNFRHRQDYFPLFSDYPAYVSLTRDFTFTLQIAPSIRIMIVQSIRSQVGEPDMAKKTRRGQKQCPKCNAWVKGTRAKTCPKCDYQFNGKQKAAPAPEPAAGQRRRPGTRLPLSSSSGDPDGQDHWRLRPPQRTSGLIKEVGGLRKMKELLEAMSVPETEKIPF